MFTQANIIKLILAIVGVGITIPVALVWGNEAVFLLLLVPVLTIPLARDFKLLKDVDEKQTQDNYRSSHVALYLVIAFFLMDSVSRYLNKENFDHNFLVVVLIVFFVKTIMGMSFSFSFKKAGVFISALFGVLWLVFATIIMIPQSFEIWPFLIGLTFISASVLGFKYRHIGGLILLLLGSLLLFYPIRTFSLAGQLDAFSVMLAIFPTPALFSGFLLLKHQEEDEEIPTAQAGNN